MGEPEARPQDLGGHRGRRRLPVRRRDDGRARRQARCEQVDRAGVELREQLARDGHARARADEAREGGDAAGGMDLQSKTHLTERM